LIRRESISQQHRMNQMSHAEARLIKRRDNPRYFEAMMCHCGEKENLLKHKFTDEVQCVECVNKELRAAELEDETES
jgi:hypothetical protein